MQPRNSYLCVSLGNSLRDGSAVFAGQAFSILTSGAASNSMTYDTNLAVVSGNSLEIAIATTSAATVDAVVTLQFE